MRQEQPPSANAAPLVHLVVQRYGARLTPPELAEVRQGVAGLALMTAALRQTPLANSDEPFAVFVPYRQED